MSQVNAIFINDNSVSEENSLTVFGLLEQYLGTLTYFDAVQQQRSPDYSELKPYNLVIWYCGTDEDDLYFWNGNYKDNPNLIEYLNNKGNLWLMGRDFLNARYIKPPRNFQNGTFLYDYLGIEKWMSESYTSDNGTGDPELILSNGTLLNTLTLETLNWKTPPEPMVDGCGLITECYKAYIFGPSGYQLYGQPAAFYYPTSLFKNTTFTFDPAALDSKGNLSTLLSDVLRFYEDILSDIDDFAKAENKLKIFPIPTSDVLTINFDYQNSFSIKISTIQGNIVKEKKIDKANAGDQYIQINVKDLMNGIYLLTIETEDGTLNRKIVVE